MPVLSSGFVPVKTGTALSTESTMRRIKATASVGKVNMPTPLAREFFALVGLLAVAVWVAYSFAEEAYLNHQLHQQVADLQHRNAAITAQNAAYRRDLASASAPSATDEVARQYGYARPDEKVFVVSSATPTPAPSPVPARAKVTVNEGSGDPLGFVWRWIAELWHR